MSTRPLVIRVEEVASGAAWVYLFESGPVWIGCGGSASLPLARPFIQEQHGIIQFDERGIRYQDLDPHSGTLIDGNPAGAGENPVTEWSRIEMGPLRLTVSRRPPETPVGDPATSPFAPRGPATLVLPPRMDLPPAPAAPAWPPRPAEPALDRLVLSDELDADVDAPSDPRAAVGPAREEPRKKPKPVRRRVRRRFPILAWLSALLLFVGIVGVAGLILQYRGLPWMPPELAARIPPWLAGLFR